jgi:hypothetical protein
VGQVDGVVAGLEALQVVMGGDVLFVFNVRGPTEGGKPMLQTLLTLAARPAAEHELREAVAEHVRALQACAGRGDCAQVARVEAAVQANPRGAFLFDASGHATLATAGGTWQAGHFETPSIAELRQRAQARRPGPAPGPARVWAFDGASPATDVGGLQATAGEGALFQVASQFNCLESPGPFITPVAHYFSDPTQGPRASVSAFPATLLRHYAAPGRGGERFVQQTAGPQIDLLADVFEPGRSPVVSGYLLGPGAMGPAGLVSALVDGFDRIRVGAHDGAQVVLGYDWDGAVENSEERRITQVFTSTVAGGGYGARVALGTAFEPACCQTLRAAYLGTLLAAVALGRTPVLLTLIGGGVFGNPVAVIWDAIVWAFDEVRPLLTGPFDVVLNGYNLSALLERSGASLDPILADVRARGGAVLRFNHSGLVEVRR